MNVKTICLFSHFPNVFCEDASFPNKYLLTIRIKSNYTKFKINNAYSCKLIELNLETNSSSKKVYTVKSKILF